MSPSFEKNNKEPRDLTEGCPRIRCGSILNIDLVRNCSRVMGHARQGGR